MFSHRDRVLLRRSATRLRVHHEIVLRHDRPPFDASPLPHIDLPRPMPVVGELVLVQSRLLPIGANFLWPPRLMLKKPDHPRRMVDVKLLQPLTMMPFRLGPGP